MGIGMAAYWRIVGCAFIRARQYSGVVRWHLWNGRPLLVLIHRHTTPGHSFTRMLCPAPSVRRLSSADRACAVPAVRNIAVAPTTIIDFIIISQGFLLELVHCPNGRLRAHK